MDTEEGDSDNHEPLETAQPRRSTRKRRQQFTTQWDDFFKPKKQKKTSPRTTKKKPISTPASARCKVVEEKPIVTFSTRLESIQKHLVCSICHGFFREPYTIPECLHTYCKSCLILQLNAGITKCPNKDCLTSLEPDPYKMVLSDRTLQEVVDKIFPALKDADKQEEKQFYSDHGIKLKKEFRDTEGNETSKKALETSMKDQSAVGGSAVQEGLNTAGSIDQTDASKSSSAGIPDDELDFLLNPDTTVQSPLSPLKHPNLRTSGRLRVFQIKKLLVSKLEEVSSPPEIVVLCNGDVLGDELSLTFIQRTRWLSDEELTLSYRLA